MESSAKYEIIERISSKQRPIVREIFTSKSDIMSVKFGYEDQLVAAGFNDGKVKIYNVKNSKKLHQLTPSVNLKDNGPINTLKWRPVNEKSQTTGSVLLVANTNGHLYQYIGKNGKQIFHLHEQNNYIMSIDYKSDGSGFATGGKDNIIRIYDQQTKKVSSQLKSLDWHKVGHSNRIFCVRFNRDDHNMVLSAGWDQNIYVWDLRTNAVSKCINGPKIGGEALDIYGDYILTGADRNYDQLQLWSLKEEKLLNTFKWEGTSKQSGSALFSCQFCHFDKNKIVAVGGNQMKVFSLQQKKQIFELSVNEDDILYTCDSSISNPKFLAGGKNGNLFYLQNKQ